LVDERVGPLYRVVAVFDSGSGPPGTSNGKSHGDEWSSDEQFLLHGSPLRAVAVPSARIEAPPAPRTVAPAVVPSVLGEHDVHACAVVAPAVPDVPRAPLHEVVVPDAVEVPPFVAAKFTGLRAEAALAELVLGDEHPDLVRVQVRGRVGTSIAGPSRPLVVVVPHVAEVR